MAMVQHHLHHARMVESDLREVMAIEMKVFPSYGHWTHQTFQSALAAGYDCWLARDVSGTLVGYFVLMKVVDEVHLLTIAINPDWQGKGLGRGLMDKVIELAKTMQMESLLLEVRLSNKRALEIYRRYGFDQIGQRKNYYAGPDQTREDALVMRRML